MKNKQLWIPALIFVLFLPLLFASMDVQTQAPTNHSYISGNTDINITFGGLANITIFYNDTFQLNASVNQTSPFTFSWPTNNGSFPDAVYNLTIVVVNSTNQTDNDTAFITNITIDNTPPNLTLHTPLAGLLVKDGDGITINVTVVDTNIGEGTNCTPTIDGFNSAFSGAVLYSGSACNGTITLNDPSALSDGNHTLNITPPDLAGNTNTTSVLIIVDNTPPTVFGLVLNNTNPISNETNVNFTVNVSDANNVTLVQLSSGVQTIIMNLIAGDNTNGTYNLFTTPASFDCANESLCTLRVLADDAAGNTNSSVNTTTIPFIVDSFPPRVLANSTNDTSVTFGDNLTISAQWGEIALLANTSYTVVFERYNALTNAFDSTHPHLAPWSNSQLVANYTNTTYIVNGSDESATLTFRVNLTDSNGMSNVTANLTATVATAAPTITLRSPLNTSVIDNTTLIALELVDQGSGIFLNNFSLNITNDNINTSINITSNSSLFSCAATTTDVLDNRSCNVSISWLLGNTTIRAQVNDNVGNVGTTSTQFFIVAAPDIINVTINGQLVASSTPNGSIEAIITNDSTTFTFNWTADTNTQINQTTIAFQNISDIQAITRDNVPAGASYTMTAGKNYLTINVTLNNSPITEEVQLNLTANVPLNITAIADQYTRDMVVSFTVLEAGVDVTNQTRFVNSTFDFVVNVTNTTHPFEAIFNYTTFNGIDARWNASMAAFTVIAGTAARKASLSGATGSNVTFVLQSTGPTDLFFDEQSYRLNVRMNFTLNNLTAYYTQNNSIHFLEECNTVPTAVINVSNACFVNITDATMLHLPRFNAEDEIFFGTPNSINVTIGTNTTINQSIIPLHIQVATPVPNSTFCFYNLSLFNTTNSTTILNESAELGSNVFTLIGHQWDHKRNFTAKDDGRYNLTVTCGDQLGNSDTKVITLNVTDISTPLLSDTTIANIGSDEVTITGITDEFATFTVHYGTDSDLLTSSQPGTKLEQSTSIRITNLNAGTQYFFNLTACDKKNQCISSATQSFITSSPSTGSSGGGGGAGGESNTIAGAIEETDSRLWSVLPVGLFEYAPTSTLIKRVSLGFTRTSARIELTINQFNGKPAAITDAPGNIYKYFQFKHKNVQEYVNSYVFDFAIPKSWVTEQGIVFDTITLYRLEDAWTPYDIHRLEDTTDAYMFRAKVPGFSFFAVTGNPREEKNTTVPVEEQPADITILEEKIVPVEDDSTFVSALDRASRKRLHPAFIIVGIVIGLVMVTVLGLQQYKLYQTRQEQHDKQVEKEQTAYVQKKAGFVSQERTEEHDPMTMVHKYITHMRQRGHTDDHIRARLKSVGWDEVIIDQELLRD